MPDSSRQAPGPLQDHRDVIALWPDLAAFAADIGVATNTAKQMRRRNSIGDAHRAAVVAAARRRGFKGVTFQFLIQTSPAARAKAGAAA